MNVPTVSVVMSVYNGEPFLGEAVESILNQTFRDFEFIVINDGSTDGTAEILTRYQKADSRVVVHRQPNQGLIRSLNRGCGLAKGRYVARIDADDVALPNRLERQSHYLEENPQVALVGSSINNIDVSGKHLSTWLLPPGDKEIKDRLFGLGEIPFCHVALVFRSDVIRNLDGYRAAFAAAEDYDLWLRIAERWQVANLPEPLVNVRRRAQSWSSGNVRQQVISSLVAWSASSIRRSGGHDPITQEAPVSREFLRSLGVSDTVFEEHLMGVYQYWIDVALQSCDNAGALRLMLEALESESWKHLNRSIVANTWLAAARICSGQGHYVQSAICAAHAVASRPIIAGRPIKRIASRLGFAS